MRYIFEHRRSFGLAIAVVLASVVSACSGGANAVAPPLPQAAAGPVSAGAPSTAAGAALTPAAVDRSVSLAPAPTSTEFFTGITPNSNPRGITRGPAGNLWFTEANANQIARITPDGTVKEITGLVASANNIIAGPDGNLWFTHSTTDTIGRYKPGGKVTEFTVGNEAYGPFDIVNGSDGALWFTMRTPSTNAIGRITTTGSVTLFTAGLTPGDVAVHDIASGPDGNLWFTEEFANKIGRITTSGVITEFSAGISANALLADISAGPDGNIWFTENGANKIGRITPSGVVTEFSKGITPGSGPGSLTMAKGSVWFTETGGSRIGRVFPGGVIKEFAITSGLSSDIVSGPPSGDLWITDYNGSGIVRVTE